jgi:tRNA U34 5-methylaminomethyl-2-thiouridine-forming methyltransferase MnmC
MSVFLRWGVFGILAVAALLYAYNASKRLAENRGPNPVPASAASGAASEAEEIVQVPEHCQTELQVAERALEARREQMPLDKLLRVRLIAFEKNPVRRERLEKVAADWYLLEGDEPAAAALSREVVDDCEETTQAP